MNAPRIVLLSAFLSLAAPFDLLAQQHRLLVPGDRVRVTVPTIDPYRFVGTMVEMRSDTLDIKVEDRAAPLALPVSSVTKLERWRGRGSKALLGAAIGGVVGAVAGILVGGNKDCFSSPAGSIGPEIDLGCKPLAAAFLGGFGLFCGAVIGSTFKTERWKEVPLDQLRIGPSPVTADGVGVTVLVRWSAKR